MKQRLQTLYYAISAFLVCWQTLIPAQLADPDLWGRLSVAALWFKKGYFPYRDVFSFTAYHHRWIDHEWLSGVLFYAALWWGGEVGLHVLKYGMIFFLFYLLFSQCRKTAPANKTLPIGLFLSLSVLFPLYGDAFFPTVRAQLFSFLFFVCFLWILERARQHPNAPHQSNRILFVLLPLGIFWANAHGGFILGLILLALYGLGAALDHKSLKAALPYGLITATLILSIAVLNPYGLDYWPFILHALTMPRPFISEWSHMPLLTLDYWETKLLMISTVSALMVTALRQGKSNAATPTFSVITPSLVLLFLINLALRGIRFKAFFALGVLFYVPVLVAAWQATASVNTKPSAKPSLSLLPFLPGFAAAWALTMILMFAPPHYYARTEVQAGDFAKTRGLIPFPIAMMQYLQASPYRGNLINPFTWGEFLAWSLYPRFKVAWDGRYEEVYTQPEMDFFTEFYALPHQYNPERITQMANRSAGDFILIEKISPNQEIMGRNQAWTLLITDGFYFLYGRKSSLLQLPPYHPTQAVPTSSQTTHYTIGDFFHPEEFSRFQAP